MRAVIWDWAWDDEYDDLGSFEPKVKSVRRMLPEPPLPPSSDWTPAEVPAQSMTIRRSKRGVGIALLIVTAVVAIACLAWVDGSGKLENASGLMWFAGIVLAYAFCAITTWHYTMTIFASPEVRRLARESARLDVFPVKVRIVQNRSETGIDHGIAFFSKDALHFRGLETEFVIGAQDLRYDPLAIGVSHGALEKGWVMPTLALRHPDVALSVVFQPMDRLDREDTRDCGYRFRHHLRLFLKHWRESRVDSLYPPLTRQPALEPARPTKDAARPAPTR